MKYFTFIGPSAFLVLGVVFATQVGAPAQSSSTSTARALTPGGAPVPSAEIIVRMKPKVSYQDVAKRTGVSAVRKSLVDGAWVFAAASLADVPATIAKLKKDVGVVEAFQNRKLPGTRTKAFVPNDPYFANNFPAGGPGDGYEGQWYLVNTAGRAAGDINVKPQWDVDTTGVGITVGIVDDGVDSTHPDLSPGYLGALSLNAETGARGGASGDPVGAASNHGTFVAGCAIARGGNGIGITGSAPLASWTAIRLPIGTNNLTDEMNVAAIEHESVNSKLIQIKNHSYGSSTPFSDEPPARAALARSMANGTIHVYAAGNDRGAVNQDANKDGSTSAPNVIVVGAINSRGLFASYSSFGANLVCVSYGGDNDPFLAMIGTDRQGTAGYSARPENAFPDPTGNYAAGMQGTSFTAPTVAGVLALAKQRQPNLNARWAMHLFAITSRQCDPTDASPVGGWKTNAAGIKFDPNYGFGLVDVDAFVKAAQTSGGPSALTEFDTGPINAGVSIPDNASLTRTFDVAATTPLEAVQVTLDISHRNRGQLAGFLTSPRGTTHRIFIQSNADNRADIKWTFNLNGFWGENPQGTWSLRIDDTVAGETGVLNSYQIHLNMGTFSRGRRP